VDADKNRLCFRTVQLGSPRVRDEGLRIGAVRFLPRGVPKSEYGSRDLFDLWLPILAPSRELLHELRVNGLPLRQFLSRYRREMSQTDARQVIELLADMARRTPVSVGCYCANESACHRFVLSELIRLAAGESPLRPWAQQSIYTIVRPDILQSIHEREGRGVRTERKRWVTAEKLLVDADQAGERVAVLFGDATDCSQLLYAASLDQVTVDGDNTEYQFSHLQPLSGRHTPQELKLCSTGQRIAPGFIRPYAIVERPRFLRN